MSALRPCHCDRFHAGRLFDDARDCPHCWLFAHRPEVRRAWGGDPADCVSLFAANPALPPSALADLLAGPPVHLPAGWRKWPSTRQAHLLLADRFVRDMPAYPDGRFAGRGAVLCGGGPYEPGVYVACQMLRLVGWGHPIQVWHRGPAEPVSDRVRRLPGVEVVDAEAHPARATRRTFGGWQSKLFAVLHSPFEEVLYLDADAYPVAPLDGCFQPANNPHGIVTWPDTPWGDHTPQWDAYGLEPDGQPALNGGHYVLEKRKAWPVLQLAGHYDNHSDYYYCKSYQCADDVGGYGDQDQFRVALHKLRRPYHRYAHRPLLCDHGSYVQAGPDGGPLFVHRFFNKLAPPGAFPDPPAWLPEHLPMEATAWRHFLDWLTCPPTQSVAAEVPGWFTPAECDLWQETCVGRTVLELGRHLGRSTCAAALSAFRVVSLDREGTAAAEVSLQRFGVRHKVWLRRGEFADLVPSSGGPFSACLIDGGHDRENVERDIAAVAPHLAPGARIGFHDYADPAFPDVQAVADAAARRLGWTLVGRMDHLAVFEVPSTCRGAGGRG